MKGHRLQQIDAHINQRMILNYVVSTSRYPKMRSVLSISVLMNHKLNHKSELKIRFRRQHHKILRIKVVLKSEAGFP